MSTVLSLPLFLSLAAVAVLLSAGGAVRGGGAESEAAGATGHGREEEPSAERTSAESQTFSEERPQGHTQSRGAAEGAAGAADGGRETSGTPPQCHCPGPIPV